MPTMTASSRHGASALSPSQRHGQGQGTGRASPELFTVPRRLFSSPDGGAGDADAASNSGSDTEEIAALMRKPGPLGRFPTKLCETADDKEYQTLMAELRIVAEKVLREDEWKYKSSDQILGFRD